MNGVGERATRVQAGPPPGDRGESLRRLAGFAGPAGLVFCLFLQLFLFGGDRREVALVFALVETALLTLFLLRRPRAELKVRFAAMLRPEIALFLVVIGWVLLQFAPLASGLTARGWAEIALKGSATLDRYATSVELAKLMGLAAVFGLGLLVASSRRGAQAVTAAFGALAGAYAAWAVVGYYSRALGVSVAGNGRMSASLFSPNAAAAVFGIAAVFGWAPLLATVRRSLDQADRWSEGLADGVRKAWPWALLICINLWAIGLTASRGGSLATLVGIVATSLAMTLGAGRRLTDRGTLTVLGGALVLLLALSLFALAGGGLAGRLDPSRIAATDRYAYWALYLNGLQDAPWTGFGLGTFTRFNAFMANSTAAADFWELGAMHNVYLQWIYEAGFGAIPMFAILGLLIARTAARLPQLREARRWPAVSLGVSALILVHSLVDVDLQLIGIAALWSFLLGAGLGGGADQARRRRASRAVAQRSSASAK